MKKFYWACIETIVSHSGSTYKYESVMDYHPFEYLKHLKSNNGPIGDVKFTVRRDYILLNWKEISKKEHDMWETFNQ